MLIYEIKMTDAGSPSFPHLTRCFKVFLFTELHFTQPCCDHFKDLRLQVASWGLSTDLNQYKRKWHVERDNGEGSSEIIFLLQSLFHKNVKWNFSDWLSSQIRTDAEPVPHFLLHPDRFVDCMFIFSYVFIYKLQRNYKAELVFESSTNLRYLKWTWAPEFPACRTLRAKLNHFCGSWLFLVSSDYGLKMSSSCFRTHSGFNLNTLQTEGSCVYVCKVRYFLVRAVDSWHYYSWRQTTCWDWGQVRGRSLGLRSLWKMFGMTVMWEIFRTGTGLWFIICNKEH